MSERTVTEQAYLQIEFYTAERGGKLTLKARRCCSGCSRGGGEKKSLKINLKAEGMIKTWLNRRGRRRDRVTINIYCMNYLLVGENERTRTR
jgi:hypothetical protein